MTDLTARFALPLLQPGQAQKEMFHNEALAAVDALLHPHVIGRRATPPATPEPGQSWIVTAGAGAWAAHEDALATWTAGGWRYSRPTIGMAAYQADEAVMLCYGATGWFAPAPLVAPTGGGVVDAEARAAIVALIDALQDVRLMRR